MNKVEARQFLKQQTSNIWMSFAELTMEELQAVKEVAANYSTTNCWFAEHMMKDAFLKLIDDRIAVKKQITSTG